MNFLPRLNRFLCVRPKVTSRGFTYIGVLIFVAVMGITLAGAGMVWSTQKKRENGRELFFIGEQYRRAIGQYYERSQGAKQFPQTIDDILLDRRYPSVQRYLRRAYFDPMTGKAEWGLVKGPDGRIVGIFSLSMESPLKRSNFKSDYGNFEAAERYSDWKFVYVPAAQNTKPAGATNPDR